MSPFLAIPLFLASLAVTLVAARLFARRLDRLGVRLRFPEALIGLLTALAADGPEISSALFALFKGADKVGVGVIVGSNAFNIAAMLGVSGVLAGSVLVSRRDLLLEGGTGAAITLVAAAVLLGWISPVIAVVLSACVIAPYLAAVLGATRTTSARADARDADPRARARGDAADAAQRGSAPSDDPTHHLLALIALDVTLIVVASAGMVQAALALGERWHISGATLGILVLAPLTSIPNAITGVRLGLASRSTALVGELFNSNTINLVAGVIVPYLFVSLGTLTSTGKVQLAWLIGITAATLLMLGRRRGMGRAQAWMLIALYGGFVVTHLAST